MWTVSKYISWYSTLCYKNEIYEILSSWHYKGDITVGVPLVTMETQHRRERYADPVSVLGTLTCQTLRPAACPQGSVCAAWTIPWGPAVPTARTGTMGMPSPSKTVRVSVHCLSVSLYLSHFLSYSLSESILGCEWDLMWTWACWWLLSACTCDQCGSVSCDRESGSCQCQPNVEGPDCDRCKVSQFES